MIAVLTDSGQLLRQLPGQSYGQFGFHTLFGWVSERTSHERSQRRHLHGLSARLHDWICQFEIAPHAQGWSITNTRNCQAERLENGAWKLSTTRGVFHLVSELPENVQVLASAIPHPEKDSNTGLKVALALGLLILLALPLLPKHEALTPPAQIMEPVTVKIMPEVKHQRSVQVPDSALMRELPKNLQTQSKESRRAIAQNLGFLGMLGKKELKNALGGMPTQLKNASAGAGAGGTEGSGGELLVGLGQGVKRTTVGNSGVAGLGGIGTKGAGGGAGGYGNSMVGSGEGKGLSSVRLSQDMVLEGGLDRNVIQATIAKYLNQVRACYEDGLRQHPGIQGQVTMNFEIGPEGALNLARVAKSTLGDAAVEGCISQKMMNWKFPKPVGGVSVKVNYPFMLRPVGV